MGTEEGTAVLAASRWVGHPGGGVSLLSLRLPVQPPCSLPEVGGIWPPVRFLLTNVRASHGKPTPRTQAPLSSACSHSSPRSCQPPSLLFALFQVLPPLRMRLRLLQWFLLWSSVGVGERIFQHSKGKGKKTLWRETLSVQWDNFLMIREPQPRGRGRVCFYSPGSQERGGVLGDTCWPVGGVCRSYRGRVRSGLHIFPSRGRKGLARSLGQDSRTLATAVGRKEREEPGHFYLGHRLFEFYLRGGAATSHNSMMRWLLLLSCVCVCVCVFIPRTDQSFIELPVSSLFSASCFNAHPCHCVSTWAGLLRASLEGLSVAFLPQQGCQLVTRPTPWQ